MSYGIVHYEDEQGEIGAGIPCRTETEYETEIEAGVKWVESDPRRALGMWCEVLQKEDACQALGRATPADARGLPRMA